MIEQIGQTLRFNTFFLAGQFGKTGLVGAGALTVDVYDPTGAKIINAATPTEIGDGWYTYNTSNTLTNPIGSYLAVFKSTDSTCTPQNVSDRYQVGATWTGNIDVATSSRSTLTAGGVWSNVTRNLTDFGLTLSTPGTTPTVNPTGGASVGGLLQAGNYYLKYTFINAAGETLPSPESAQFTVAAGNIPQVTLPSLVSGATGYNIYLTQAGGASGTETLYMSAVVITNPTLATATLVGQTPVPTVNTTNDLITKLWNANARTLSAFGFNVTVGTNNDKTSYKLDATGLDQISIADPGAISNMNTWPKLVVAMWRYYYKMTKLTQTLLQTYKDDNSSVNVSMTLSNDGTTQTKQAGV